MKPWKIFSAILLLTGSPAFGAAFQFGGIREDIQNIVSGAYAAIMSSASTQNINISGTATTTIMKLPDATTLQAGYFYRFFNGGTGPLTISDSSSTQIGFVEPGAWAQLFVSSSGTSGGPWLFQKGLTDNAPCSIPQSSGTGVVLIDWKSGPCFALTLSTNTSIVFTNRPTTLPHKNIFIRLTNTASNFLVTFQSANVLFSGGTPPTETAGAKIDGYTCDHDPVTGKTICSAVQNF